MTLIGQFHRQFHENLDNFRTISEQFKNNLRTISEQFQDNFGVNAVTFVINNFAINGTVSVIFVIDTTLCPKSSYS